MIDFDEIRKEVAIKHNVLLGNDDPLLMNVTINDLLLQQCLSDMNEQQQSILKTLLNAVQKGTTETSVRAKALIEQGTEHACDQISTTITATMDECREEIRADLRLAWNKIERARKITMFSAAVSSVCALIAVLAMLNVA